MAHRAGWDATFSAPKSVSLTALVGGDARVREAHRASVAVALDEMERYVQARIGGNHPAETTGKWVAATFEHDSARPVDGLRRAPTAHARRRLQSHRTAERRDPRAATAGTLQDAAVWDRGVPLRARHAPHRPGLRDRARQSGQPEIRGYTTAYLDASSPRRQQIQAHLAKAPARRRRRADRRASDAGSQARPLTRGDAAPASGRWRRPSAISPRTWCRRRGHARTAASIRCHRRPRTRP